MAEEPTPKKRTPAVEPKDDPAPAPAKTSDPAHTLERWESAPAVHEISPIALGGAVHFNKWQPETELTITELRAGVEAFMSHTPEEN